MLASKEEIKIQQAVVHILDSALGMPVLSRYAVGLWFGFFRFFEKSYF